MTRAGWVGLFGAVLIALGGVRAGATPHTWDTSQLHSPAVVLTWLGLFVLIGAWLACRHAMPRQLTVSAFAWSLPLLVAPPLLSRDVYAYAGQAALVAHGVDPYRHGPAAVNGPLSQDVDPRFANTPSPYGPLWLALSGLVARASPHHLLPAVYALKLLSALGLPLLAYALPRLAGSARAPQALWLGLANPLLLLHGVGGGHNDLLMLGLLAMGLAMSDRSLAGAAALVTLGALVKAPAALALPFLPLLVAPAWRERIRPALVVCWTAAATAVAVELVTGLGWGWVNTLGVGRAVPAMFSLTTGLGFLLAGGGHGGVKAVTDVGTVVLVLVWAGLWFWADRLGPVRSLGLALLAASLLGTVVQPWYPLWGVIPLATVASARAADALAAGCALLCLLVWASGQQLLQPPLWGLPMLLAVAAVTVTARSRRGAYSTT